MGQYPGKRSVTLSQAAEEAIEVLKKVFEKAGVPGKFWTCTHSAGYDSRVMSLMAKEVGVKGMRAAVWEPEVEEARPILEMLGWEGVEIPLVSDYYLDTLLNMRRLSDILCDHRNLQLNQQMMRTKLGVPGGSGFMGAIMLGEFLVWNRLRKFDVAYMVNKREISVSSTFVDYDKWLFAPFAAVEWLEWLCDVDLSAVNHEDLRLEIMRILSPGMEKIGNPRFRLAKEVSNGVVHEQKRLSSDARDTISRAYRNTWWARQNRVGDLKVTDVDVRMPWVEEYAYAAILDTMRYRGVHIEL
jgi:hypothetical protein